ncbi:MAG TPA: radical SAM protein [Candidatus Acidoferrales bacterium]|nr:radical SAM protein [Candidatus Acidoferrales bacterium]
MSLQNRIRRQVLALHRSARTWAKLAKGLGWTRHVLLAHIIPIRRCNLSCAYCNEYDKHSAPVPVSELNRRIDLLASFGTGIITLSGGEPLLHPDLDDVIRQIRRHRIIAGMITNGYLLTRQRIEGLNAAGLEYLQISIDNVQPDDASKKSLKVLDRKLVLLGEFADFHVNINSVLGSGVKNPEDALTVAHRAVELGFTSTVGILHDENGQLLPLGGREREIFREIMKLGKRSFARINGFQNDIADGREHQWRCRAGSRYLYICEDGLVHYCSQQRGHPGIPIQQYTAEMRRREFFTRKGCAPRCTISCVQQVAALDNWRAPQHLDSAPGPASPALVQLTDANRGN